MSCRVAGGPLGDPDDTSNAASVASATAVRAAATQSLGDPPAGASLRLGQDDEEPVPAAATDDVVAAAALQQRRAERGQHAIARHAAAGLVDALEAVEIETAARQPVALALRAQDLRGERVGGVAVIEAAGRARPSRDDAEDLGEAVRASAMQSAAIRA